MRKGEPVTETKDKKLINASEIGTYCFCPRAWALEKRGYRSANRTALDEGSEFHRGYGRRERLIRNLKILTAILILILFAMLLRTLIR